MTVVVLLKLPQPLVWIEVPLPTYSPDLNPIEHSWVTIKKWLRSHLLEFESIE